MTAVQQVMTWPLRRWCVAMLGAIVAGLIIGVPTGIVSTSWYSRMTPVTWWDWPVWAVSAALLGLTAATYVRRSDAAPPASPGRAAGSTLLSTFAVGCPICNKLVVALIGVDGALSWWAPIQPVLGIVSVGLLLFGLRVRIRGEVACRVTPAAAPVAAQGAGSFEP